ncbi:hypothetical protein ACFV2N_03765 [Streptomyces sp. NPDC059680]|uniref:hypothetical protein n=1 Tax=Streptomyces sp. NPDC059680 TaxID=3346904 RepID=UPI003683D3EE
MDTLSDYRYAVRGMIERERDGDAIAMVVPALMLLCQDSYVHGQWDEAENLAQQGLELATGYGYSFWERQIRAVLTSGAALRGDVARARARSKETTTWAAPRGMGVTLAYARSAGRLAAMGQGDFEEAHTQVAQIDPPSAPSAPSAGIPNRWVSWSRWRGIRSRTVGRERTHRQALARAGGQGENRSQPIGGCWRPVRNDHSGTGFGRSCPTPRWAGLG